MREIRNHLAHAPRPCLDRAAKQARGEKCKEHTKKAPERKYRRQAEHDRASDTEEKEVLQAPQHSVYEQGLDAWHIVAEPRQQVPVPERLHHVQRTVNASREQRSAETSKYVGRHASVEPTRYCSKRE